MQTHQNMMLGWAVILWNTQSKWRVDPNLRYRSLGPWIVALASKNEQYKSCVWVCFLPKCAVTTSKKYTWVLFFFGQPNNFIILYVISWSLSQRTLWYITTYRLLWAEWIGRTVDQSWFGICTCHYRSIEARGSLTASSRQTDRKIEGKHSYK